MAEANVMIIGSKSSSLDFQKFGILVDKEEVFQDCALYLASIFGSWKWLQMPPLIALNINPIFILKRKTPYCTATKIVTSPLQQHTHTHTQTHTHTHTHNQQSYLLSDGFIFSIFSSNCGHFLFLGLASNGNSKSALNMKWKIEIKIWAFAGISKSALSRDRQAVFLFVADRNDSSNLRQ